MQSGNAVVIMQKGGVGERDMGGKFWLNHHPPIAAQQNFPSIIDQRDGLLAWLREEFAASNAMIDALCRHLTEIGEPGEYDEVIGCIAQRRCNWTPVLYMQHHFPVTEVLEALTRAGGRRQQRGFGRNGGRSGREFHRKRGGRTGQRYDGSKGREEMNSENGSWFSDAADVKEKTLEDKQDIVVKPGADNSARNSKSEPTGMNFDKNTTISKGLRDKVNHTHSEPLQEGKWKVSIPKVFLVDEIVDGKTHNIVEGLKLYEGLLDGSEVSRLTSLVNDLRTAGRRGQLDAQTFVVNRRPVNGHGREMIQFGVPIADAPPEAVDGNVEPIPSLFVDVIERLLAKEIVTVKPESCIIDVFNEGDYSQPHIIPHWFGRPVCVLFLTDCDLTFGKVISADNPGEYRGTFNLSLKTGSVLTLQGRSADFTRRAIPSLGKERILVTLVKSDPKIITSTDSSEDSSSLSAMTDLSSNRVPAPPPPIIRSPNHLRPTMGPKHYNPGVWLSPPIAVRSPLPLPNGLRAVLLPAPIAAPIAFPAAPVALTPAVANGVWPAVVPPPTPSLPPPRFPIPGTGVFLPHSISGSSSKQSATAIAASNGNGVESPCVSENDTIPVVLKSNSEYSNGEVDSSTKPPTA